MIFLLNLIGFLIEMIVCPILMIPFLLWRLLMNIQIKSPEASVEGMYSEEMEPQEMEPQKLGPRLAA